MGKKSLTDDEESRGTLSLTGDPAVDDPEPTKFIDVVRKWPKSTFCIIGNEGCERFSFYGMRTVLTLYLINILSFSENKATIFFHAFTVLAYTSPLLGSILADGFIGKFWTILIISLIYASGQILLAVSSTFTKGASVHPWLDILGLAIIGFGTGGIKPCVSAFGGDQFKPHYLHMISLFFSVFYFTINFGSTISSFITPEFRSIPCLGSDSCYPLAFGVPAVLMIVATGFFVFGSFWYVKVPPKENVIARVAGTITRAIGKRFTSKNKYQHWLDYALDGHTCESDPRCQNLAVKEKEIGQNCAQRTFVNEVKTLTRVCVMMLPVPMFWALFDQQGSRWIIQAVAMDARLGSSFSILPDQMGTLNAILIMCFIPLFQFAIYPIADKIGITSTHLRRMTIGGLLAALAFGICGLVQLSVNKTLADIPANDEAFVSVVNSFPTGSCDYIVNVDGFPQRMVKANDSLIDNKVTGVLELYRFKNAPLDKTFQITSSTSGCVSFTATVTFLPKQYYILDVSPVGWTVSTTTWDKPQEGQGQFAMSLNLMLPCDKSNQEMGNCKGTESYKGMIALCRQDSKTDPQHPCDPKKDDRYKVWKIDDSREFAVTDLRWNNVTFMSRQYASSDVRPGTYQGYYVNYTVADDPSHHPSAVETISVPIEGFSFRISGQGAVYVATVSANDQTYTRRIMNLHTVVPENHVHILWQVPQYVVITAGEILFSITGLEFAYAEASPQLKSVVQAIWLFTVAVGDLIIIAITEADLFQNLATEMFAFAGCMVVVMGIFVLLAIFYYEYAEDSQKQKRADSAPSTVSEAISTIDLDNKSTFDMKM